MEIYKLDQYFEFPFNLSRADTGAASDADATPTYSVYEENSETAVGSGNCAKRDDANTLGYYYARGQMTTAAGYEVGKSYVVRASATVNSVSSSQAIGRFRVIPEPVWNALYGGTVSLSVDLNANQDVRNVSGNVAGNVNGNVNGNVAGSVKSVTDPVTAGTVNDKNGYSLSTAPPTASDIATAVWNNSTRTLSSFGTLVADIWGALLTGITTVGSIGVWLKGLNNLSTSNVETATGTALATYGVAVETAATQNKADIIQALGSITVDTSDLATADALSNLEGKVDDIKDTTDQFVFTTPNRVDASADVALTEENLQAIANAVIAGTMGDGSTLKVFTSTVNGAPTDGVKVVCYKDSALTQLLGSPQTSRNGGATYWMLNPNTTYYFVQQMDGIQFNNPEEERYVND